MKLLLTLLLLFSYSITSSQVDSIAQSNLIQTDRMSMEYIDFGGSGIPLINVQGIHNFFGSHQGYEDSKNEFIKFLNSFTDNHWVLAPIKRGYGRSEFTENGFDVITQAEDLIAFMDALNIQKAIFLGRLIASQEMTYLAENYPERIEGLVFYDMTLVLPDLTNPDIAEFLYYDSFGATDQGDDPWSRFKSRFNYKPAFLIDNIIQSEIPALWFYWSGINDPDKSIYIKRLSNAHRNAEYDWKNDEIKSYYKELIADKERWDQMKKYLIKNNPNSEVNEGFKRFFSDNLEIVYEDDYDFESFQELEEEIRIPKIKDFLKRINQKND